MHSFLALATYGSIWVTKSKPVTEQLYVLKYVQNLHISTGESTRCLCWQSVSVEHVLQQETVLGLLIYFLYIFKSMYVEAYSLCKDIWFKITKHLQL